MAARPRGNGRRMPGVTARIHIVTDDDVLRRSDFQNIAVHLLVTLQRSIALHLRSRTATGAELFRLANELAAKCQFVGSDLLVNDRVDVALAFDHVGVELGARGIPIRQVREVLGSTRRIGYSAHAAAEAAQAERDGADFILAGTIYQTPSHPAVRPGGIALLGDIVDACSVPVIAIGGVTAARVLEVLSTGAYGVAVIRAVWDAPDPVQAAAEFAKIME